MKIQLIILFQLILSILCSLGDIQTIYIKCIHKCYQENHQIIQNSFIIQKILFWDKESECNYICMRNITIIRQNNGLKVLKYYGHWPYIRLYGIQEPASAFFSLFNILPHFYHLILKQKNNYNYQNQFLYNNNNNINNNNNQYYMNKWIYLNGILASIAWICSTIFHTRKINITINLDYMSALIFLFHGFWLALRRTTSSIIFNKSKLFSIITPFILFSCCAYRLVLMYYDLISFDEHMNLCILLAVAQSILWVLWCIFSSASISLRRYCFFLQVWFALAALLELYDFPPIWDHFDAHSLWHALTIPLGFFWYQFWINDMLENNKVDDEIEKRKQ